MPTCADSNLRIWNRVPDGSRLEVRVVGHVDDPKKDQFVANAEVEVTNDAKESWTDDMLRPGPKTKKLVSPHGYNVKVRVAFAAKDSAQVQARVVKPDGTVYGKEYCRQIDGKANDISTCTLIAVTVAGK
jgi:hypothetical protein